MSSNPLIWKFALILVVIGSAAFFFFPPGEKINLGLDLRGGAHILMTIVLGVGIFAGAVSLILIELIPLWVFLLMAVLAVLFVLPRAIRIRRSDSSMAVQGALQKPLERAAALALFLQYFLPWAADLLNLNLF